MFTTINQQSSKLPKAGLVGITACSEEVLPAGVTASLVNNCFTGSRLSLAFKLNFYIYLDVSGIQKGSSYNGCKIGLQQCLGSLTKRNTTDMSSPSTNTTSLRQEWGGSSLERPQGETKNCSNNSRKSNLTLFLC